MRRLSFISLVLIALSSAAQFASDVFNGDIHLGINSNGIMAIDLTSLQNISHIGDPSADFLNQLGIWMMAVDQDQKVHINSQYVIDDQNFDFSYAPLDTFTGNQAMGDWNHVWLMEAADVASHIENFTQDGYIVPSSIKNWPAKSGQDLIEHLAPFADYNNNGIYDPENGDFPVIQGERAVYCIFNDNSGEHKVSKGIPLEVEVHLMIYEMNEWPNTLFLEYFIINRSVNDYQDVKLGLMLGGQLGNASDNAMGSMSEQNTVYLYNGDEVDENGFGTDLPYIFCRILDRELSSAISFSNDVNDTLSGRPQDQADFIQYMNGSWLDGSSITLGGNGRGGSQAYSFHYDISEGWSEASSSIAPGERNCLAMCSISELNRNSYVEFNAALGYGTYSNAEDVHKVIEARSKDLRDLTSVSKVHESKVKLYPNPNNGTFNILIKDPGYYQLKVIDNQGKTLFKEKRYLYGQSRCNFLLAPGVYILELNRNGRIFKNTLNVQP